MRFNATNVLRANTCTDQTLRKSLQAEFLECHFTLSLLSNFFQGVDLVRLCIDMPPVSPLLGFPFSQKYPELLSLLLPIMPIRAADIFKWLADHPSLLNNLEFNQVNRFLCFTSRLWLEIVPRNSGTIGPSPLVLPPHVSAFLSGVLSLTPTMISLCWITFSDIAAKMQSEPLRMSDNDIFCLHGEQHQIGMFASVF
jgi:hypothetical protein